MQVRNVQKLQTSYSTFSSSFQEQKLEEKDVDKEKRDSKEKKDSKEKNTKPYLYRKLYRFKSYWYLMEDLRPVNWKPDRGVQQQIEEKLQKNTCFHKIINQIH